MLIYRNIIKDIKKYLDTGDIITIYGARQVGKTCLMKYIMNKLLKEGKKTCFIDLEDMEMRELLVSPSDFLRFLKEKGMKEEEDIYVFLDEVHYLDNPSNLLKIIHDHHSRIHLIVSGSSSFAIRKKFKDILTGRKLIFQLFPLSFEEFLRFKGIEELEKFKKYLNLYRLLDDGIIPVSSILHKKLLSLFEEFAIWGGYPRVALTNDIEEKALIIKEIYESYVEKDVKDFIKIENVSKFNKLVKFLSVQSAGLLNLQEVSKEMGIARTTLENYLFIMEQTFVIKRIPPYYTNRQKELVKTNKLYFSDTGMRNYSIKDMRELSLRTDRGSLIENMIFCEIEKKLHLLDEIFFWRTQTKKEVDFILKREGELIPIEAKYQHLSHPILPSSFKSFIRLYNPKIAIILNKGFWGETHYNTTKVLFAPAYTV